MRCHYEILNVPRDADEAEIKLAYKKLALKWHPDKNLDNIENATEQFQLVQQAYEILGDRQERAWYDNHREQILHSSDSEFKDDNLDVYQYFTTTCFKGYDDNVEGFYSVYRNIFEQIAKEDLEYMDCKEDFCNIPMFGNSTSDYDDVVAPFYNFWMSYSTKKSYVWLDPYSIKEAKNRRVLKLLDKENEKIRQKARRERNEEVRSLVAFVRKRDRRVQVHTKLLETRKLENRRKQERHSEQTRLQRLKQLNESSEQADWMKFENVKSELEEIEKKLVQEFGDEMSDGEQSSNSEELDFLYCVACNKVFKNPNAFENHESSKKHKENVSLLKENIIDEDKLFDAASDNNSLNQYSDSVVNGETSASDSEIMFSSEIQGKTKKKNKKSKNKIHLDNQDFSNNGTECSNLKSGDINSEMTVSDIETKVLPKEGSKIGRKSKKSSSILKVKDQQDTLSPVETDESFNQTNRKQKQKKKKETKLNNSQSNTDYECIAVNIKESGSDDTDSRKLKSKNQKRESNKNKKAYSDTTKIDIDHTCVVCDRSFGSKNKLFDHLKKTGHSVYIDPSAKIDKKTKC